VDNSKLLNLEKDATDTWNKLKFKDISVGVNEFFATIDYKLQLKFNLMGGTEKDTIKKFFIKFIDVDENKLTMYAFINFIKNFGPLEDSFLRVLTLMDPYSNATFSWFLWRTSTEEVNNQHKKQSIIRSSSIEGRFILMAKGKSEPEEIFNHGKEGYFYKGEYFLSLAHIYAKYCNAPSMKMPRVISDLFDRNISVINEFKTTNNNYYPYTRIKKYWNGVQDENSSLHSYFKDC